MTEYRIVFHRNGETVTVDFDSESLVGVLTKALASAGFSANAFVKEKRAYVPLEAKRNG